VSDNEQRPEATEPESSAEPVTEAPVEPTSEFTDASVTPEFSDAEPTTNTVVIESLESEPVDAEPAADTIVVEPVEVVEVVEEPPVLVEPAAPEASLEDAVLVETVAASSEEPVVATDDPAAVVTEASAASVAPAAAAEPAEAGAPAWGAQQDHRVVYVEAPQPPRKKGNRGIGTLIALLSAILFAAVFALVTFIVIDTVNGRATFDFIGSPAFYVPVLFFAIGFVLLVLVLNRASWWVYVIGSLVLAVFVYLASISTILLSTGIISKTPDAAAAELHTALASPIIIVAALVAREVALWAGMAISARGRRVKARNAEARAAYDRDEATRRAEYATPAQG
jgi:hypothetical protein